jgi:DNA (cytosine-5)-methyltransferase 1
LGYSAVSLFSGCGGFCEGMHLAGFDVRAAVELDRFACETYRHNFPDVPLFEGDVSHFLNDRAPEWRAERSRFEHLGDGVDVVFGGPPCQGYSQIGTRKMDDPRNQLYEQFVRVLVALSPRVFIMENVPNMLMMQGGHFRDQALDAFAESGYRRSAVRVLHASDFGVPQLRKRAIFIGIRDDLDLDADIGEWMDAVADAEARPERTVWDAIRDLPEKVSADDSPLRYPASRARSVMLDEMRLDRDGEFYTADEKQARLDRLRLHNHHTKEIQARRKHLISHLRPGMKADSLPKELWDGLRPEKWRRLDPNTPAYTILAQMHRDLSEWVHPKFERWITVREAARLQSFHDGFVFQSSEWQMLKQIGNAVPPLLGRAAGMIAMRALQALDSEDEGLAVQRALRATADDLQPVAA